LFELGVMNGRVEAGNLNTEAASLADLAFNLDGSLQGGSKLLAHSQSQSRAFFSFGSHRAFVATHLEQNRAC